MEDTNIPPDSQLSIFTAYRANIPYSEQVTSTLFSPEEIFRKVDVRESAVDPLHAHRERSRGLEVTAGG